MRTTASGMCATIKALVLLLKNVGPPIFQSIAGEQNSTFGITANMIATFKEATTKHVNV